jgi:hypothetical protein
MFSGVREIGPFIGSIHGLAGFSTRGVYATLSGEIMEWLSQNWIWLALGIGVVFMMSRGAKGGGCCGGHGADQGKPGKPGEPGTGETGVHHHG